ncbi:CHASE domain-containing protein, partial [Vibrio vulnificus]
MRARNSLFKQSYLQSSISAEGIIQSIYPLAGNEKAIGHNLLKDDARKKEALNAVESGKLTLAGP